MRRTELKRRSELKRGTRPLARRTPLPRGNWTRPDSDLWTAIDAMCPETGKGIADRHKYDEERATKEWARKYGSIERVLFVKKGGQCSTPGCYERECVNSHIDGEGTSRKGHYTRIIRQCDPCHREMHGGVATFVAAHPGLDLERECEVLEIHWLQHGADWIAWYYGDDARPADPYDREPDEDRLLSARFGLED